MAEMIFMQIYNLPLCSNFDDGFHWMECTINIHVDLLMNGRTIPYKYVIMSSSRHKDEHIYEYLLSSKRDANRCLKLPITDCHPKGKKNEVWA